MEPSEEWTRVPVPSPADLGVPAGRFVAHSGVASTDPDLPDVWPRVTWDDVSDAVEGGEPFEAGLHPGRVRVIPPSLVAECKELVGASADDPLAVLGFGTIINTSRCPEGPFPGFARAGATYSVPYHRFDFPTEEEQRVFGGLLLKRAQLTWDRDSPQLKPEKAAAAERAFLELERTGYANPGQSESDADVVAAWRGPDLDDLFQFLAVVRLRKFGPNIRTIVLGGAPKRFEAVFELNLPMLGKLAGMGRDSYRADCLQPMIAAVY